MELLVCAATWEELRTFGGVPEGARGGLARRVGVGFLLTGVGIPCALAAVLEAAQAERPAAILNIGIAGAYPDSGLSIGGVVLGDSEVYGDVGFELPEPPSFRPIHESPLGDAYRQPFALAAFAGTSGLPVGRGCTVNACTGTEATGRGREEWFGAAFETMEGAAVAQAGTRHGIPVSEIRAISNIAARRDLRPENIRRALDSLTTFFRDTHHARTHPGHLPLPE